MGGGVREPGQPPPPFVRVFPGEGERGSVPLFILFLFFLGLISHSTKITSLNSISWSKPNRYYDLLSTIRSQIRQGSILINLETNSKVEILFVFGKRLNKLNND